MSNIIFDKTTAIHPTPKEVGFLDKKHVTDSSVEKHYSPVGFGWRGFIKDIFF